MPKGKVDEAVADGGLVEQEPSAVEAPTVLPTFAELYARLSAPFDKTFTRDMPGGRGTLTYITGEQAMNRLTEVLGPNWDWEITKQEMLGDAEKGFHIVVSGKLTVSYRETDHDWASSATREGIGGSAVKQRRDRDGNQIFMDLGNDFKAAETGALKRAAAKFGVGLYLYEKGEGGESELPSYQGGGQQAYGQPGAYTPVENRQPTQFARPSSTGNSTTGVIEVKSGNGLKIGGVWFNASKFNPIDLTPYERGQTVTVEHAPGKTFIDGLSPAGGAPTPAAEEVDAF